MNKKIILKMKKMNQKAYKNGDVPISCIIVKNNEIISKGYNKKEKKNNPIYHAEILAILKAAKKMKSWNLSECELYVTLEPCNMCKAVINEARIKKVFYILNKNKIINDTVSYEQLEIEDRNYFLKELKEFFVNKR